MEKNKSSGHELSKDKLPTGEITIFRNKLKDGTIHDNVYGLGYEYVLVTDGSSQYVIKTFPETYGDVLSRLIGQQRKKREQTAVIKIYFCDQNTLQEDYVNLKRTLTAFINMAQSKLRNGPVIDSEILLAKVIAKQLFEYLNWLQNVAKEEAHGDLNPNNIFFINSINLIKVSNPLTLNENMILANPGYYLGNIYVAPEYNKYTRTDVTYAGDVWAVGAILFSILKRDNYLSSRPDEPTEDNIIMSEPLFRSANINEKYSRTMDFFKKATHKDWLKVCKDPVLATLVKSCLSIEPSSRPSVKNCLDFLYSSDESLSKNNLDEYIKNPVRAKEFNEEELIKDMKIVFP
jgi:hypothetical protein